MFYVKGKVEFDKTNIGSIFDLPKFLKRFFGENLKFFKSNLGTANDHPAFRVPERNVSLIEVPLDLEAFRYLRFKILERHTFGSEVVVSSLE